MPERKSLVGLLRHIASHPAAVFPRAPRGVINSARAWVKMQLHCAPADIRRGPVARYWDIDPPILRSLPAPRTIQSEKAPLVPKILPVPGTALFFLRDARILGDEGVVISSDNRVFAEFTYVDSSGGIDSHSVFRRRRFPRIQKLSGWYSTLCYPSSPAYYHWLLESLPRLRLLEPHLQALDGVFVPGRMEPSILESLTLLGLKASQLIPVEMSSHFAPEHLLVPKYCAGLDIPAWVPEYLQSKLFQNGPAGAPSRRIYISRADAGRRRVTNEAALGPILDRYGFEIVRLRELTFRSQAELFSAAMVVIGPHGAGLGNAVFCQPGTTMVELLPSRLVPPHLFFALAGAARMTYWYLRGSSSAPAGYGGDPVHLDFEVDPDELERTIRAVLDQASSQQ